MAADLNYAEHVITLIKSVCYYHQDVRFYLIQENYTKEWFDVLNSHLFLLNSEIIPVTITQEKQFGMKKAEHITDATFYRYFVQYIPEDRLLYLDSDIVINGNLLDMYYADFKGNLAMAVEDMFIKNTVYSYKEFPSMKPYFNAGVLLINNAQWRKENIAEKLVDITWKYSGLLYADQDVLNIVLKNRWCVLSKIYNYQTGVRYSGLDFKKVQQIEALNGIKPIIIHYTSKYKPWINDRDDVLMRDKYWFYYQLSWHEIRMRHSI
ncbi:MAG: glycosyltransferase family 8 protein [[Pasteurella] mairii]|nr:glycosyltransferase family 8 protein [[Pasteurella] mairii]